MRLRSLVGKISRFIVCRVIAPSGLAKDWRAATSKLGMEEIIR
jgi:hypothetical protein